MPLPVTSLFVVAPDLSAPTCSITSPANGSYQTKTISLTANAADDRAVTSVLWQVDGTTVGTTTVFPYTFSLNTALYPDGDHTVTAVAKDAAGHSTSSTTNTIHVANPPTTAQLLGSLVNPIGGGSRRNYAASGSFGSPNYANEGPGVAWPGNPYTNWGYIVQAKIVATTDTFGGGHSYESINGIAGDHATGLTIGGTQVAGLTLLDNTPGLDTGWVTVPNGDSGTAQLQDWLNNSGGAGGSAFTGNLAVYYRYQ